MTSRKFGLFKTPSPVVTLFSKMAYLKLSKKTIDPSNLVHTLISLSGQLFISKKILLLSTLSVMIAK